MKDKIRKEVMKVYNQESSVEEVVDKLLVIFSVGGPASASVSEGEQLGNEAGGKAGEVEVLNIKTGQLLIVNGYGFMFGKDLNSGEIRCFNIENVNGESREGALH